MINVNKAIIQGRLGADPERKGQGEGFVVFSVATSESWRDRASGERKERTQWHKVVVYNEQAAKFAETYLHKGDIVYVEGQIETRDWEDAGVKKYITEIVVRPFSGSIQGISKDGGGRRDDAPERSEDRGGFSGGSSRGSASRPGRDRPGQGNAPAFESGGMDDDIPF